MLTLVTNAYLEDRRARDTRELESLRLASEHARRLRDERLKAYAGLSLAAEEVLQFIRSEMPALIGPDGAGRRHPMEVRWPGLRTELRKAYNQVALFGGEDARAVALQVWRVARNGGNDFLRDLESRSGNVSDRLDLSSSSGRRPPGLVPSVTVSWTPAGQTCRMPDTALGQRHDRTLAGGCQRPCKSARFGPGDRRTRLDGCVVPEVLAYGRWCIPISDLFVRSECGR